MPLKVDIQRPAQISEGKTQGYRLGVKLSGLPDSALFVCFNDIPLVPNFDHVATLAEMLTITTDPAKTPYRTDTLDLWVTSRSLADDLLQLILGDLQGYLNTPVTPSLPMDLSGASI